MKQAHIDCLKRLCKRSECYGDIIHFLLDEKIINEATLTSLNLEQDKVSHLCHILFAANKEDKIQLLDFHWTLLPVERIRVKIVTDMNTREYTHNF